eukprot:scaffold16102_cov157-Isochrysis_galbana.AAC.3
MLEHCGCLAPTQTGRGATTLHTSRARRDVARPPAPLDQGGAWTTDMTSTNEHMIASQRRRLSLHHRA